MSAYRGAVLTIVVGVLLITLSEFASAQQPDFSGQWLRNAEMSPFWRESYDSAPRKEARKWQQEKSGSTVTERLTRLSDDQFEYLFVWEDSDLFEEPVRIRSVYDRAPN